MFSKVAQNILATFERIYCIQKLEKVPYLITLATAFPNLMPKYDKKKI